MDLGSMASGAGGISSAFGMSQLTNESSRDMAKRAEHEAEKNRAFQKKMATKAHQYEMRDLKRAGLNPILTATGGIGASTPSGSTAPMPKGVTLADGASAAKQVTDIANVKADTIAKEATGRSATYQANMDKDYFDFYNNSAANKMLYQGGRLTRDAGLGKIGAYSSAAATAAAGVSKTINAGLSHLGKLKTIKGPEAKKQPAKRTPGTRPKYPKPGRK